MRAYSIILAAIIVLLSGVCAEGRYGGGTGTAEDPYRIATPEDLNDIGNHQEDWNKHFVLINDVNLTGYTGTQFNIIGNYTKTFTGVFDGNDRKIWNFTWASTGRNYIGLFGFVGYGGRIRNLGVEDVNMTGNYYVGGLVGFNDSGPISNCYSTGTVSGSNYVGGLVGYNGPGPVSNCYSTAAVSGSSSSDSVGGLIGRNYGSIKQCYSTGAVSGSNFVGGLLGHNGRYSIGNCYSTGAVSGDSEVGGLVGHSDGGSISQCYSTGAVSGSFSVGGLVGYSYLSTITACFWDIETSSWTTSAGGTGKTTAEMKTKSIFTDAGWNFVEIWGIGENQTYPFLLTDPAGDSNHDKKVNLVDLAILALHWLEER